MKTQGKVTAQHCLHQRQQHWHADTWSSWTDFLITTTWNNNHCNHHLHNCQGTNDGYWELL